MKIITLAIVALLLGVLVSAPVTATGQPDSPIETPTPFISLIETPMPSDSPMAITLTSFTAR